MDIYQVSNLITFHVTHLIRKKEKRKIIIIIIIEHIFLPILNQKLLSKYHLDKVFLPFQLKLLSFKLHLNFLYRFILMTEQSHRTTPNP